MPKAVRKPIERFWWLLVTDQNGDEALYGPTSVIYRIHARHCGVVRELQADGANLNTYEFVLLWMSRRQIQKDFPELQAQSMEASL